MPSQPLETEQERSVLAGGLMEGGLEGIQGAHMSSTNLHMLSDP